MHLRCRSRSCLCVVWPVAALVGVLASLQELELGLRSYKDQVPLFRDMATAIGLNHSLLASLPHFAMSDPVSIKGSSRSRSIEEAIKEALDKISDYNDNLPGADSKTTARLEAIHFTKGGSQATIHLK